MENMKNDIEVQRKVAEALMDKQDQILCEVKKIKEYLHLSEPETLHRTVRAECETNGIACNTREPHGLMNESIEGEQLYQDASALTKGKVRINRIDNQLYGCIGEITEDSVHRNGSVSEKDHRLQAGRDKKTKEVTKPKEFRSNSLQTRVKTVAVQPRPRSAIYTNKATFDERECLANALQYHVEDLVDGLVFHESELPDGLLVEECLTEDECSTLRKLRDRKDQIRVLLSLIKGRDLRVLNGFLKHIAQQNPMVAQKIKLKFENNKRDGLRGKLCTLCNLEKQFNVKHVADSLWAIQAIDDGLYNKIIYSDSPVGAQNTLWKRVFHSLNGLNQKQAEEAQDKLKHALSKKNLFMHLADGVKDMLIKNHGKLTCACEPRIILPKRTPSFGAMTSAESFLPDSSSDGASNDFSSFDGTENGDMQERDYNGTLTDGMSLIAEVNETPTSPSNSFPNATHVIYERQEEHISKNESICGDKHVCSDHSQINSSSTLQKKPVPARKPPVPLKKPELKPNSLKKSTPTQLKDLVVDTSTLRTNSPEDITNFPSKTEAQNSQAIENEADEIPPLPEKKNKQVKS
ncbi:uncharacterized protein LOC123529358 isoform X2 [Mercenaria mercenaria]|nr:uncharacterized protein LOC123529358 isoform X2 [Mercenaria mercenaria]